AGPGVDSEIGPAIGLGDALSAIAGRVQIAVPVLRLISAHVPSETQTGAGAGADSGAGAGAGAEAGAGGDTFVPRPGPAELEGYGPIDTDTARRIAGHTPGWDRVLTHPVDGTVLAVDRYRPGEALRRLLGARDQHCRFPGCTRRLDHCDIDHTVAAAHGGPTELANLAHLCRRHHTLKHFEFLDGCGWKPRQHSRGNIEWLSPTGRRYTDAPSSRVRFAPVAPPGPSGPEGYC
ncbi:MAG: HNH endonuclease signature motif containing protein, partial [Leucobacter sp.]